MRKAGIGIISAISGSNLAMQVAEKSPQMTTLSAEATPLIDGFEEMITEHARRQMQRRHLSPVAVSCAFLYGREVHTRGAIIFAIGRKEIRNAEEAGVDLRSFDGVQVVCSKDGAILTAYRNQDFGGLRPGCHHQHFKAA